jgi:hypothetical protein
MGVPGKFMSQKAVIARILGGLGNQMFQYACGKALAKRTNSKLLLDLSGFMGYRLHEYGLCGFKIDEPTPPFNLRVGGAPYSILRRMGIPLNKLMSLQGFRYVEENQDLSFKSEILSLDCSVYLDGYWQSERYFADIADEIRSTFLLSSGSKGIYLPFKAGVPNVSLHIRRGDYVHNAEASVIHGVLGLEYYQKAIAFLEKIIEKRFQVFIFSDDIEWAKKNLLLEQDTFFVSAPTNTPQNEIRAMAKCDHHIIANSTFSWWGAWLNPTPGKIVIAPKQWFMTAKYLSEQIYPTGWRCI